jgi:hypothetical protein
MKASELRIGNLVDLGNRIAKVIEIGQLACVVVDLEETQDTIEDYERTNPIPITEEWLLNFGFEDKKTCFNLSRKEILGHDFGDFAVSKYDDTQMKVWRGHKYIGVCHVQYVHQLQNLYFALTGEELTLKSEQ